MLQKSTFSFLKNLKANNDREWFDAHRKEYAAAKENFESLVQEIHELMLPIEPGLNGQDSKANIFRIFRDVRFAKDKSPYKISFGVVFSRGGRKWEGAGYYLHLQPGECFAGGGMWMPPAPLLKSVRQEIDYDLKGFEKIIQQKEFVKLFGELEGDSLQRPPKGYMPDNPAIEYIKMTSITVGHKLKDADLQSASAAKDVVKIFGTMKPLIEFLNRPLE
jgi:uncharacterized protein (TIGR02453 family)